MSTADLFQLPSLCQRNVGSVGSGVWRKLAANTVTTGWALTQQLESLLLMHHWRVLEGPEEAGAAAGAGPLPSELSDIEAAVSHWRGSEIVRRHAPTAAVVNPF